MIKDDGEHKNIELLGMIKFFKKEEGLLENLIQQLPFQNNAELDAVLGDLIQHEPERKNFLGKIQDGLKEESAYLRIFRKIRKKLFSLRQFSTPIDETSPTHTAYIPQGFAGIRFCQLNTNYSSLMHISTSVLKSFNISGTKCNSQLQRIFRTEVAQNYEKTWSNYTQMRKHLPPFDTFLSKVDQYINALSNTEVDIDRLAYDIVCDTTLYGEEMVGVAYDAEFSNRSIFITLSDLQHKDKEYLGWKFHISISEKQENISKAWNVVKDILIKNNIPCFKVLAPNITLQDEQVGKQITIYPFETPEEDLIGTLRQIECKLTENSIKNADFSEVDKKIEDSEYIAYRNDKGTNGEYIPAGQAKKLSEDPKKCYNLSGESDPFLGISLLEQKHCTLGR